MAGHSKWANIQHRKGKQDAMRGKIFTKLVREITVSARQGGGDINANPRLRLAVDKAVSNSMPKENIERAIKKALGELDDVQYEELRYEGYAPGGIAILIDCMTDNRQRTVSDVRHAFTKCGGNLGTDGSVSYLFKKQGVIFIAPGASEDQVVDIAIDAGAEDVLVNEEDGSIEILTSLESFQDVKDALLEAQIELASAEITMRAETDIVATGDVAISVQKLLDWLEDLDDVQNVYSNAQLTD